MTSNRIGRSIPSVNYSLFIVPSNSGFGPNGADKYTFMNAISFSLGFKSAQLGYPSCLSWTKTESKMRLRLLGDDDDDDDEGEGEEGEETVKQARVLLVYQDANKKK